MRTNSSSTLRSLVAATGVLATLAVVPGTQLRAQTPTAQDSARNRTWGTTPAGVPNAPPRRTTTTTPTTPTSTPTTPSTPLPTAAGVVADSTFVREAQSGNLLEVRLGTLADQKASNPSVKQFGQQMVKDHTTMGQQWAALAAKSAFPIRPALDPAQQQSVSQLSALSGAEFDRAYMSAMVQDHQNDIAKFQAQGPAAKSADVQRLAAIGLPIMQQHLTMAQQLAQQVGVTTVATNPTNPSAPTTPYPRSPTTTPYPTTNPAPDRAGDRTDGRNPVRADGRFAQELAYGHIMEVRLAQMAQQQAKDGKVRQFAKQMEEDFSQWQTRWTNVASNNGMKVNPNMGPDHRSKIERLRQAGKHNFDRVYLDIVTENLGSMLPYLQKEGRDAQKANVRDMVNQEIPVVRQHLSRAQSLEQQVARGKGNDSRSLSSNDRDKGKDKDKDKDKDK
jgi:putative membrane protein